MADYIDREYEYRGLWGVPSKCGLKIVRRADLAVVVLTELYDSNPGSSVTNWSAQLATELAASEGLDPAKLVVVEHTPDRHSKLEIYDETFDRVSYSWDGGKFTDPRWTRLSKAEFEALIEGKVGAAMRESYFIDGIRAVDAKFEAQKIAFGPIAFQAARAMRDLGILESVAAAKDDGIGPGAVARSLELSAYGVGVLLEMGLSLALVKLKDDGADPLFVLGKTGHFVLYDEMTRANMDFVGDVCYAGAAALEDSIRSGKPEGLKVFGDWPTIYDGLSRLPEGVKRSWFAFDHHYSDLAFPDALPIVFAGKPSRLFDVGGNTAKWALACCRYDPDVKVTIVDLPGQLAVARRNAEAAGFGDRVSGVELNVLDPKGSFPAGADAVWMSQFLDCFSLDEVEGIMKRLRPALRPACDVFVLEPFWDRQRFEAASYSLHATSLYFTCMANGNSKMYRSDELVAAVERAGFGLAEARHGLGANSYSLLRFRTAS